MTTSANPAPSPSVVDAPPSELSEIWRAIGRLEGTTNALLEGQQELKQGQCELNRRMDRMLYAILAGGGALLVVMFANRFVGG